MARKTHYFLIYKPFGMLTQFSGEEGDLTLASLGSFPRDVYPVGRLDKDSEGLLLLTNDKQLNHRLLSPQFQHEREYWVQVEGIPTEEALLQLEGGVSIQVDGKAYQTLPAKAKKFQPPAWLPPRVPPIRYRETIPDSWLSLTLHEGKNRQVRKMTAAVGFPTLRLIRYRIGQLTLEGLQPGKIIELSPNRIQMALFGG